MNWMSTKRIIAMTLAILLGIFVSGGLVSAAPLPGGELGWKGIVQFEAGTGPALKSALVRGVGGVVEKDLDALNMAIVNLPNEAAANGLAHAKGVLQVEADSIKTYCEQSLPWGVNRIDADLVWNDPKGTRGAGVNVAVLDTGIDTNHPDLAANLADKYSCVNAITSNVEDLNGHGTHCSGIIAAVNNTVGVVGVGPEIDLYMVQISRKSTISETDIIEGINWCIATHRDIDPDNDIQVMSMSFGGGYSSGEADALETAYNEGIVLVAAAGNESGAVIYPAALPNVIAVSATDSSDRFATFSNFGTAIDLAAPGVSIYSTYLNDGYATMSGTSMACPHVAGAAAMVIASGINDNNRNGRINDDVEARLKETAEDIHLSVLQQGAGLVDVEKAVLGTVNPPATGSISGTVTDSSTEAVIAGATVNVGGTSLTATTDANGAYMIANVATGVYSVTAAKSGYVSATQTGVAVSENTTTTVDFALTRQTIITMKVDDISFSGKKAGKNLFLYTKVQVSDENNNAVSGATVNMKLDLTSSTPIKSWTFSGVTATDGTVTFTLSKATAGEYTATITNVNLTGYEWSGGISTARCTLSSTGTATEK